MKGRKPKPRAQQIFEGDPRKVGEEKLKKQLACEPQPSPGLTDCPKHLFGKARDAWNFWKHELELMHIDKRPDSMMLEGACVAYSRAVKADLEVENKGFVVEEPIVIKDQVIGYKIRRHPADIVSNRAWAQVRAFCTEFGLSPASRTRFVSGDQKADDDDSLLNGEWKAKEQMRQVVQ